jgi:hypothetical protein
MFTLNPVVPVWLPTGIVVVFRGQHFTFSVSETMRWATFAGAAYVLGASFRFITSILASI